MPLYDYECEKCGTWFERISSVSEADAPQMCSVCDNPKPLKKIIKLGHGGIQRKDPTWIKGVADILSDDGNPLPINTVEDLRTFYANNPNIRPKESHPAFESSLGDSFTRPDEAYLKDQRRKKAGKVLMEHRAISI